MKKCNSCGETKEPELFHKRAASKDGMSAKCKSCQKEYDNLRLRDPKRMKARREYQKTANGRAAHNRATKKWAESNAIKRGCHIMVGNAIKSGRLKKKPCEVCGTTSVHAHHDDYAMPLTVRWLCELHHADWHKENGEGANAF